MSGVTGALRRLLKRSIRLRRLVYRARVSTYAHPRWRPIIARERAAWDAARARTADGPRILIATGVGGHPYAVTLESLLAVALTLRGADVHFLLCDEALPACELAETSWFPDHRTFVRRGPRAGLCAACYRPARAALAPLGLPIHRYGEFLTADDVRRIDRLVEDLDPAEMEKLVVDGVAVGEHAKAGALRFYARGTLDGEPHAEGVLRRYLRAALVTSAVADRLLATERFDCAVFQHGIYVPQGLMGEVARRRGVRVVNWNVAFRKRRFLWSHRDTYHRTMMTEPAANWEHLALTPELERGLLDYLKSRWQGSRDWIFFHERPIEDAGAIVASLGLDPAKPCIGMLTNVMWDAQIHYPANAFPSMLDWAIETIAYFAKRPDLQLLIRVHPAEIRGTLPSRQPIVAEITKAFGTLPPNVFVIAPGAPISTYAAMLRCDAVIIFGTKTGVELTSLGVPVIVAGEAWIRGKGIAMDAASRDDYFRLLDRLPLGRRLPEATVRRARAYAYHFFFRRMVPVERVRPTDGWPLLALDLASLDDCRPGRSPGLDVVCRGILEGVEFIYPEEQGLPGVG